MSDLTANEAFDRLRTSFRTAIELCRNLAKLPMQGPSYKALVVELELIEGASRQIGYFRDDMRWMKFGYEMARFHQRIGDVVRSHGARTIFMYMANMIEGAMNDAEKMRTARTGRRGMILPKPKAAPHRDTRPVAVKLPSGLLVPAGAALH